MMVIKLLMLHGKCEKIIKVGLLFDIFRQFQAIFKILRRT